MFSCIDAAAVIFIFLTMQALFAEVADIKENHNRASSYMLALGTAFLWLLAFIMKFNRSYEVPILANRVRSSLIFLLYAHLSKISQYTMKSQEFGQIINLLSNDLNAI